ncbi:MAG TPA: radical SAM protein, partial [Candidatus Bathyarchaeia archaeon]|nr:radical SAM protein [Candidatus Bathyarchaeia archaeon]
VVSELIDEMTRSKKLCRYLHLPIQYGHDEILKRMGRKYHVADCVALIEKAKRLVPEITIGTDIIVGFPGETNDHFEETCRLLSDLPLDYFHVFSFSARHRARAKDFPNQVSKIKMQERSRRLRHLSLRKRSISYTNHLGKIVSVLFEQNKNGHWLGVTDHFVHVAVPATPKTNLKNTIRRVRLERVKGQLVLGKLVSP